MHMYPINFDEFCNFGDIIFEISKRQIIEKVIYLSICYFTLATEIRFAEIDKMKKKIDSQ